MRISKVLVSLVAVLTLANATTAWSAQIIVVNFDAGSGQGFDDPTPAAPVGGNPGITIGEQRLFVFQIAAQTWGNTLASSEPIFLAAFFQPLFCTPNSAVLGSAGPLSVFANFPGAALQNVWYYGALADSLAGFDLDPVGFDMIARFNGDIGINSLCLTGQSWYNGIDHNNDSATEIDLLSVVLHEIAHGLGHLEIASESTGTPFFGLPDVYMLNMLDLTSGKTWEEMTDAERLASQVNTDNLVWSGSQVSTDAATYLGPKPTLFIDDPEDMEGAYEAQPASFGPPIGDDDDEYEVSLVDDGDPTLGSTSDACEAIPKKKAKKLRGKFALIDRGGCAFTTKVANVQAAGAKGAIIANNRPTGRTPMGGADPSIDIPSVGITMALGGAIKAALNSHDDDVEASFGFNQSELAGTSQGLVRLYAPGTVSPGSSKSHWDTSAAPNLLMEPFINDDLTPSEDLDLSPSLMADIGWVLGNPPKNPPNLGGGDDDDDDDDDDDHDDDD